MFNSPQVTKLIELAIEEDYALGDITTELAVAPDLMGSGAFVAKEKLVVCGAPLVKRIFSCFGWQPHVEICLDEGQTADIGDVIVRVEGRLAELITAERTVLNFLQHLSGIATYTRSIVRAASGIIVLDTRKTTPGFRLLEKYAARVGGAKNHRFSLGDMMLIKDNHIDANGGDVRETIKKVKKACPHYALLEVEVRSLDELRAALEEAPDIVMLDNMPDGEIKGALSLVEGRGVKVEVSGGITRERLPTLRSLGVKVVSMGSLSSGARGVDIAFSVKAINS